MPWWLLFSWLMLVWCLWAWAAILERSIANVGLPEDKRGNVSITPVIPLCPLVFWGIAAVIDRWWSPWGSWSIAGLHAIFAIVLGVFIIRDSLRLRVRRQQHLEQQS